MSEQYPAMLPDPESLAYGDFVIHTAARELRSNVNVTAASLDAQVDVEQKIDHLGAESPVTKHDKDTEERIGSFYTGTSVRVKGEEAVTTWPEGAMPTLELHVDPIDGTQLFVEYFKALIAWSKLPEDNRPPRPICGAMVSAGAIRPGGNTPEWSVLAAPFMSEKGIVRWSFGPQQTATRFDPDGTASKLPHASDLEVPTAGGTILVASTSSEKLFGEVLRNAGYKVVKYKSAVAAGLCAMDGTLFGRLRPDEPGENDIVGAVMGSAKNWDVAGIIGIANDRGHFVSDIEGRPRTFEDGKRSAVFAPREAIGRTILRAIAG